MSKHMHKDKSIYQYTMFFCITLMKYMKLMYSWEVLQEWKWPTLLRNITTIMQMKL